MVYSRAMSLPFFFLPPSAAPLALVFRVVVLSLGIVSDLACRSVSERGNQVVLTAMQCDMAECGA